MSWQPLIFERNQVGPREFSSTRRPESHIYLFLSPLSITLMVSLPMKHVPATQYTGSVYFFITRLLASGVRLYATCIAVGVIMGWPLAATITLFTVVSIVFIAFGSIKAVVWAGAYQALFFVIAGAIVVGYLIQHIDCGSSAISAEKHL